MEGEDPSERIYVYSKLGQLHEVKSIISSLQLGKKETHKLVLRYTSGEDDAVTIAVKGYHHHMVQYFFQVLQIPENHTGPSGMSPLEIAVARANSKMAAFLKDHQPSFILKAMAIAVRNKDVPMCDLLFHDHLGTDIEESLYQQFAGNWRNLKLFAVEKNESLLRFLFRKGVPFDLQDLGCYMNVYYRRKMNNLTILVEKLDGEGVEWKNFKLTGEALLELSQNYELLCYLVTRGIQWSVYLEVSVHSHALRGISTVMRSLVQKENYSVLEVLIKSKPEIVNCLSFEGLRGYHPFHDARSLKMFEFLWNCGADFSCYLGQRSNNLKHVGALVGNQAVWWWTLWLKELSKSEELYFHYLPAELLSVVAFHCGDIPRSFPPYLQPPPVQIRIGDYSP
eukprot:TRINITY_DN27900_c0_g1_i1.p1 TRINITY_DN27900_c0_g1~~TRINITY_DN27900_c0_g1_i1.p1  ORF type:complete len:395 (+),score=100.00 TRINITY_DN27900_c0_g1_i1:1-1185(+)